MDNKLFPPLGHIGIIVPNVDEEVKKYTHLFGAANFVVKDFAPLKAWCNGVEMLEYKVRVGMGSLNNGTGIELIQPITPDTMHDKFLKQRGGGIHHVAFNTSDFDWWREYFVSIGAQFVFEAEIDDHRGYRRCFYAQKIDTDCIIEFSQIPIQK